jgi:hypothetical protein
MSKPRADELLGEGFESVPVRVTCFRRKVDGNLYFVTDDGQVLDKYVKVVDSGGIAVVSRQRGFGENLGGRLLRLGAAILTGAKGVPVEIARELLGLSQRNFEDARVIESAVRSAKEGDTRSAVLLLADAFGPRKTYELLAKFSQDPRQFVYDKLLEELMKRDPSPPEDQDPPEDADPA